MRLAALMAVIVVVSACSVEPPISVEPPEGWLTDDRDSWWLPGTDTAAAFRNLESFDAMGIAEESPVYSADRLAETQLAVGRFQMKQSVRTALLPLYRNHPEVVDSLFRRHVEDDILPAAQGGDVQRLFEGYRREAYRTLRRRFSAPAALTRLGIDIPVPVPDSLRSRASGRAVEFQVFVGSAGRPLGIRMLKGVHPALNRIALRAVTQVEWQPAHVVRGNRSLPIDAWVQFSVRYPEFGD